MSKTSYKKFYLLSLLAVILVSAYPVYMGAVTMIHYIQNGYIDAANYQKYVIPYTPLCFALIACTALMPVFIRLFKKHSLLAASACGTLLFILAEVLFEQIQVLEGYQALPADAWQYSLCIATPQVLQSIGQPFYAQNNPAYKIHFYIIALVILLAVIHVIHGFLKMIREGGYEKKRPLIAQLVSVAVFTGLCILACFTAFYRNGTLQLPAISAVLMSVFFIVFGITAGVYAGCLFYGRKKLLALLLPAAIAVATTLAMYIGELVLTGGVLFCMGSGLLFEPKGGVPFAIADFLIMFASGAVTYFIMYLLNKKR